MKKENKEKSSELVVQTTYPVENIRVEQICLYEIHRLRKDDDSETVDAYVETYKTNGDENPFPPCGGLYYEKGRFILTAGRHRVLAAIKAGIEEIPCYVYPDMESAIWYALGDNRTNGLRNRDGDLKKMVGIALTEYPEKSHGLIAKHIGCSPQYVDKIARQLPTSGQLPEKRIGRDGKAYPVNRKQKATKTASAEVRDEPNETVEPSAIAEHESPTDSVGKAETVETPSAKEPEADRVSELESPASAPTETPEQPTVSVPPITGNDFFARFKEAVQALTATDQQRVRLFRTLIRALYHGFEDKNCLRELLEWNEEEIKKFPK